MRLPEPCSDIWVTLDGAGSESREFGNPEIRKFGNPEIRKFGNCVPVQQIRLLCQIRVVNLRRQRFQERHLISGAVLVYAGPAETYSVRPWFSLAFSERGWVA